MRRIFTILALTALATMFVQCRRDRVIPDDTLADIFYEAFLTNAYIGIEYINTDSLQIYEPIFQKYGYTSKDVRYTVGNFSRRKSARLGNVVEQAIERLDKEGKMLERQVMILDTIRNVAIREFTRTIRNDSIIEVVKAADSAKLLITLAPIYEGEYEISYDYTDEEYSKNHIRRAEMWLEQNHDIRRSSYNFNLREKDQVRRVLKTTSDDKRLVLNLGKHLAGKGRPKKQKLTIRNLRIRYKPTAELAVDSLFMRYVDTKIFNDALFEPTPKDSGTLPADSARTVQPTADERR
ncbi:MAG: DUF4296 domain-containing protein [Alistipes sp.]